MYSTPCLDLKWRNSQNSKTCRQQQQPFPWLGLAKIEALAWILKKISSCLRFINMGSDKKLLLKFIAVPSFLWHTGIPKLCLFIQIHKNYRTLTNFLSISIWTLRKYLLPRNFFGCKQAEYIFSLNNQDRDSKLSHSWSLFVSGPAESRFRKSSTKYLHK